MPKVCLQYAKGMGKQCEFKVQGSKLTLFVESAHTYSQTSMLLILQIFWTAFDYHGEAWEVFKVVSEVLIVSQSILPI